MHVATYGGYVMRQFDFAPLYRSTVGFDRLAQLLDSVGGVEADAYPPYNIERLGENEYRITMAVAGFAKDEIKIEVEGDRALVSGEKKAEDKERAVPASRHRRALVRAPLPARRPCRGQGRRAEGRPAPHRPRAQRARAHEAAHDRDRVGQPTPSRSRPLRKLSRTHWR